MGTPEFAVGALEKIIEAGHEVVLCVTQPDKPKGRGKELAFSPVKECAVKHGIPVFQPEKIKLPESVEELRKRLITRATDPMDAIETRVAKAAEEMTYAPQFDKVLVNDDLQTAYREAEAMVDAFLGA